MLVAPGAFLELGEGFAVVCRSLPALRLSCVRARLRRSVMEGAVPSQMLQRPLCLSFKVFFALLTVGDDICQTYKIDLQFVKIHISIRIVLYDYSKIYL